MTYDEMHRIPTPCSPQAMLLGMRTAETLLYKSIPRAMPITKIVTEFVVAHGNLYAHCYVPDNK